MNCPQCSKEIAKPGRRCAGCGFDFGKELQEKFSSLFSWKDELDRLTELQNSLFAGIANVSAKIKRYEALLRRELEQAAVLGTSEQKKAPRIKKRR